MVYSFVLNNPYQVKKTLRLQYKAKIEECVALHMTNTKKMISGISDFQIKEAIKIIGGEVNFQVKYNGTPGKSFLVPMSAIPDMILDQWKSSKLI